MADDVNALGANDPAGTDPNNVPGDLQDLKDKINAGSIVRRLTQAQIDALPAAQKPIGVLVHNLTTQRDQRWNGVKWVALLDSGSPVTTSSESVFSANVYLDGPTPTLVLDSTNGGQGVLAYKRAGQVRWNMAHRTAGELAVNQYSAAGTYNGTPLLIAADGRVTLNSPLTVPSATTAGQAATLGQVTSAIDSVLDGLDSVSAAAASAQSTANTAVSNAAAAQSTANTAESNAATAQSTANGAASTANAALPKASVQRGTVAPAAGGYVDVTFSPAFAATPIVVVSPLTDNAIDTSVPRVIRAELTASGMRIRGLTNIVGASWIALPAS